MYRGLKVVLIAPVLNEEKKIGEVVRRAPRDIVDEMLVVDDGSTDASAEVARAGGATVLALGRTVGVGAALRAGYDWAREHRRDVIAVCAGNNKDSPEEIPRLLDPIVEGADFVQGSRFLAGGRTGRMPLYRKVATRLHPLLFSLSARQAGLRVDQRLSGVPGRACSTTRASISTSTGSTSTSSSRTSTGRRFGSATAPPRSPVTKIYPPKRSGYTKMKPITGWWSMLRPIVLLGLGLRK